MNDDIPLTLQSFPRAVLHIDGDAFLLPVSKPVIHSCKANP
jgi:hypothetical protein